MQRRLDFELKGFCKGKASIRRDFDITVFPQSSALRCLSILALFIWRGNYSKDVLILLRPLYKNVKKKLR